MFVAHTLFKNGCNVSILSGEEQEQLLHLACHEDDVFVARTLLKNSCTVRKLTEDDLLYLVHSLLKQEIEELLRHACCEGCVFAVHTIVKNGCSISILSTEEQEQLFHLACHESDGFVACTILRKGCSVNILSIEEQEQLLHLACRESDVLVAHTLIKNGCNVSILSTDEQEQLFHLACHDGVDVFVIRTLLKNGCSVRKLTQEDLLYLVHSLSKQEVEDLLRHACHQGDVFVVHTLVKKGFSVSILSTEEQEELLHCTCREDDIFVAHTLLNNNCNVSILSTEEQEQLLHIACPENDLFVAHTLIKDGCRVKILSTDEQEELLRLACHEGDVFVTRALLENGCSVRKLAHENLLYLVHCLLKQEVEELLHHACHEGCVFAVRTLVENGCSVSILSTEEQEDLLHLTCYKDDVFVARTLLKNGCSISILSTEEQEQLLKIAFRENDVFVIHSLLEDGCRVSILSTQEQEKLLHLACRVGAVLIVEALLASGCNINCVYSNGFTPLMVATEKDHEEVVKKLILANADLIMQTARGDTALHLAASANSIQCGILLAEGGASVRTKNNLAQTPLDLASTAEFKEAIKQALSFTTRKALCIIGNAESGKSTLIAALQAESNSFLGKIVNRFRRVSDRRLRTAGIETVSHCSQKYGEVLFFDFAGQDDYHGPHQMFLESLLSKPGVSMTLLLVVKMTEEEDAILHQLHRWLTPVALMAIPASPPHVIIIGSFLDKVKSKEGAIAKLTRCIEAIAKDLRELSIEFVGCSFLNCRQPQSKGIDQLCTFLHDVPIPEFRAACTRYSLAWVLSQIRLSIMAQAVQLQEFSIWIQDNRDNLPLSMPHPEEVCQDLSAAGHALYLPNKEHPLKSWLVLDLPSILHDVYGTLFSKSKEMVNEFGLLHCDHLSKHFPRLDLEMVQQLLISLEFCLPVDPVILKVDLSKLTQSKKASGWLFFPALISAKHPHSTMENLPQPNVCYLCWQLRTIKKHSISPRILQTILLRLAAHFVVKQQDDEGVQQHYCSICWNLIAWQSADGVDVTVHIINNRVIQVIGASIMSADKSFQYLTDVISDILSTVHRLSPKLAAGAYIVHPPRIATSPEGIIAPPPNKEMFSVAGIQSSMRADKQFALSLKDGNSRWNRVPVTNLFGGYTPSLEDIVRINWTQSESNPPQLLTEPGQPELHMEGNGVPTESETLSSDDRALLQSSAEPSHFHASSEQSEIELHSGALTDPLVTPSIQALQISSQSPTHLELHATVNYAQLYSSVLDVLSTPAMRDMDELVVTPVAANWQRVALRLGVEGCVNDIIFRNHPNDCEGACRDMLNRWLRGERHTGEERRTWSTLLTALGKAGFDELVKRLQREHFQKATSS